MTDPHGPRRGLMRRCWARFWSTPRRLSFGTILIAGGLCGVVFWGAFNTFMEFTNTEDFCLSCHEMRDNVGQEWKQSAHYRNASGVRAICSDCHVPKDWTAKLIRKIHATSELYHHFAGTIGTPEKFEAKRPELAERVWAAMKATDSRECRNCHSYDAMDFHKQSLRAQEKMQEGLDQGKTCIECHTGIAHKRPPRDD